MADLETTQNKNAEIDASEDGENGLWLGLARTAYNASTNAMDVNLRGQWERNLRNFRSQHPNGSKYDSAAYKGRSKLFRPKTRASVRKGEAAAAAAFFATQDVTAISANDESNPAEVFGAKAMHQLVNWRLTHSIPWFLTLIGGYQECQVLGACVAHPHWKFEEVENGSQFVPELDQLGNPLLDQDGTPLGKDEPIFETVADKPQIDLLPLENVRLDRGADWRDPINTSPYLIIQRPMYVVDVKDRMAKVDPKTGQGMWKDLDDSVIHNATKSETDSTRQAREGDRQDPHTEGGTEVGDFDIVWVHHNFIRKDGKDYCFYTMGTHGMLTDPKPVHEEYPHLRRGERPYVLGIGMIEAHKTYPSSKTELTQDLQTEANDIVNQRLDNVKFAMNGRVKIVRGQGINVDHVKRSMAGGAFFVKKHTDVEYDRPADVTSSAFAEQDRVNVDFDEVAGNFSVGSVQSNRTLNETVGGMELMSGAANGITEYDLRTFGETFVEPVLRQIVALERRYESDETVLRIAGQKAGLGQEYFNSPASVAELLQGDMHVTVNVGIGATDPIMKLNKFERVIGGVLKIMGDQAPKKLNMEEIVSEAFGLAGYKDGTRFFKMDEDEQNPDMQALIEHVQQLEAELQNRTGEQQLDAKTRENVARINALGGIAVQDMKNTGALQAKEAENRATLVREMLPAYLLPRLGGGAPVN